MTTKQVFTYWPLNVQRVVKRWWIRRQLQHVQYQIAHLQSQRENDRHVERLLMGREALLRSDLRQI